MFFKVTMIIINIANETTHSLGKVTLATYQCKRLDIFFLIGILVEVKYNQKCVEVWMGNKNGEEPSDKFEGS